MKHFCCHLQTSVLKVIFADLLKQIYYWVSSYLVMFIKEGMTFGRQVEAAKVLTVIMALYVVMLVK
jgi:hypothetical protein